MCVLPVPARRFFLGRTSFVHYKATLMSEKEIANAVKRVSYEIVEQSGNCSDLLLLGIRRRGVPLAKRMAANIKLIEGLDVPVGELDITFYRDDLSRIGPGGAGSRHRSGATR